MPPFRLAAVADAARLHPLIQRCYRGDASRVGWTHEADLLDGERVSVEELTTQLGTPGDHMLVAEADGAPVGCVRIADLGGGRAYLGMLAVAPERQAAGLGRALIAAAEGFARQAFGAARIEMTVIDTRAELIAWYVRRGYAPAGTRAFPIPVEPPLTMVVLEKSL